MKSHPNPDRYDSRLAYLVTLAAGIFIFASDAFADGPTFSNNAAFVNGPAPTYSYSPAFGANQGIVFVDCSGNGNCDGNFNQGSYNGNQNGNGNVIVNNTSTTEPSGWQATTVVAAFAIDCSGNGNCNGNNNFGRTNGSADGNLNVGGNTTVNNLTVNHGSTVNMGGNIVHDVATPVVATDAANKGYVDAALNGAYRRIDKAYEGTAIALALGSPIFHPGQTFVIQGGWGDFEGTSAIGFSAAGLIAKDTFGKGSTITLSGGVGSGTQYGTTAGRAAVAIGW